jgi:xanthine dehydrogenase accessory factor
LKGASSIFRFLLDAAAARERTALLTITDVHGSSPRAPGTHMAVTASGRYLGSFSGGCTEAAIVGEAQRVLAGGSAELVRLGAGSRLIDIRLPCGGAIDFLVSPDPPADVVARVHAQLEAREPVALALARDGTVGIARPSPTAPGWAGGSFRVTHQPDLRVVILGDGAEASSLAVMAGAFGVEALILKPSAERAAQLQAPGIGVRQLTGATIPADVPIDARTAIVLLLHDHEMEAELIASALDREPMFVGAMGSSATHRSRIEALRARGVSAAQCARVVGPIGLIPASRDPATLALSVLSQLALIDARSQTSAPAAILAQEVGAKGELWSCVRQESGPSFGSAATPGREAR